LTSAAQRPDPLAAQAGVTPSEKIEMAYCERPSVSVIIPTKHRAGDLEAAVASVLKQTILPTQVIVVDQSADEESSERVNRQFAQLPAERAAAPSLRYIRDSAIMGGAEARNRALSVAEGDVWLFLDDDVILDPDFLEELLAVYGRHPEATGVSGVVTNYARPPWAFRWWRSVFARGPFADDRQPVYWRANQRRETDPVRVTRLGGGLMSFRAEAVRHMRFDERLVGVSDGEDVDFCSRLGPGAVLLIAPQARLIHNQSPAGRDRGHELRRQVKADYYLYRGHWQHHWKNRLGFLWLNVGYAMAATFASARRLSLEPWRALLAGTSDAKKVLSELPAPYGGSPHRDVSSS
jgi:glucosyl-dolichyl phosphate glucuronosyltransferase